jgi:transcription elongation factor Elf1
MAEIFKCRHCRAEYEVTYIKAMFGVAESGTADCQICGQEMASWKSSKKMPFYMLKKHSITNISNA